MKPSTRKLLLGIVCFCTVVGIGLVCMLVSQYFEYKHADETYTEIKETHTEDHIAEQASKKPVKIYSNVSRVVTQTNTELSYELPALDIDFKSLLEMNHDFCAWIYIPNSRISYPVVKSHDNIDYTYKMFNGEKNAAGTIFSDSRIAYPFIQRTILYGHNMKNGTMFKDLYNMEIALQDYPDLWIYLPDGTVFHYVITTARRVNKADPTIYRVDKTESSELVLSTCVDNDTRLVILAQRDWAYRK